MVWSIVLVWLLTFQATVQPRLAQLWLPEVWQSGMVVQRDQPILVWGWSTPGTVVPESPTDRYLYYGWQPYTTANVVNSDGLPLTTFRIPLP